MIMRLLYTCSVKIYGWTILAASPFNTKAKKWIDGRRNWFSRLQRRDIGKRDLYWFHFASLGEFEQGRPIMEKLKQQDPHIFLLITFFSPSGYEVRKHYPLADHCCYLPIDSPTNARLFLDTMRPKAAFFIKYEFWFNFLHELKKRNIPTYLVSGIFRPEQHFFRWYGGWFRRQLKAFHRFFVQNKASAQLLREIGFENVTVTGDTRFDRVLEVSRNRKEFPLIKKFAEGHLIFIAGSNWPKDDELLIPFINKHAEKYRFILAPHNIDEEQIANLIRNIESSVLLYSEADEENITSANVLLIDSVGLLSAIYQYGHIAYIGGGFGANVHNILEAAAYGLPAIFGPNYHKFRECKDLVNSGGAFTILDLQDLINTCRQLEDETTYRDVTTTAKKYVEDNSGATDKVLKAI